MQPSDKNYYIFLPSYKKEPKEITNLLNKCNLYDNFIVVINYTKYTNFKFVKKFVIKEQSEILMHYAEYCQQKNLKLKILIDATTEAPTYRYNLTKYCDFLTNLLVISLDDIIIVGTSQHQYDDKINFSVSNENCIEDELYHNSSFHFLPTHHFVSLARVAKPHRLYSTTKMIDTGLTKFGKISLGSGFHISNNENNILNFLPDQYKSFMPMIIDGKLEDGNNNIFSGEHPDIKFAFVNLVQETAFSADLNYKILKIYNIDNDFSNHFYSDTIIKKNQIHWNVNSITEKSIKPFAWGQVPLFNTIYDNIKYVRELGFDLFDDIIDHSYDMIEDSIERIDAIIGQLENICAEPIEYWQQYKTKNIHRFMRNREIAQELNDFKFEEMTVSSLQKALDKYNN